MQKKVKTKRRRPATSGRPRFTEGEIQLITLKVSKEQYEWLKNQGEMSATIRAWIDQKRGVA